MCNHMLARAHKLLKRPEVLLLLGLSFAVALDFLTAPMITTLILWALGVDTNVPENQDDLGLGVLFMGTFFVVSLIMFPIWAWFLVKRMFKLFGEKSL